MRSTKQEIEAALAKAIHAVIVDHAVKEYMAEAGEAASIDGVPLVRAKVKAIYGGLK